LKNNEDADGGEDEEKEYDWDEDGTLYEVKSSL